MSHTPRAGDDLLLILRQPAAPRAGNDLLLVLADDAAGPQVILSGTSGAYRGPVGQVSLDGTWREVRLSGTGAAYYPPLLEVDFGRAGIEPDIPPPEPLPEFIRTLALPWQNLHPRGLGVGLAWDAFRELDIERRAPWQTGRPQSHAVALPWAEQFPRDRFTTFAWDAFLQRANRGVVLPWQHPPVRDREHRLGWDSSLHEQQHALNLPWHHPPPRDTASDLTWDASLSPTQRRLWLGWSRIDPRDRHTLLPWGPGRAVQRPVAPVWGAGPNAPDPDIPVFPALGVYTMNNTVTVVRLPERTPIATLGVQLSAQLDNTGWSLSLTLASQQARDLLDPASAGPREVEVAINGFILTALIEDYSLSDSFGRRSWSVQGRSRSAELGAPYAPARSYKSTGLASAQQHALAELENTGWSLDWQVPDWNLAAGQWSYEQLTPLEAVGRLAAGIGAVVQSDPASKTLHVISRYPVSPWHWPAATVDAEIAMDAVLTLAARWKPAPLYNAVYVSGGTQGVDVNCTRSGTQGDAPLGTVVDALIVTVDAGAERGRVEIARTGPRIEQALALPVMAPVGVLRPGALIQITDGWRGLVTGVSITAQRGEALDVQQQLTVERLP